MKLVQLIFFLLITSTLRSQFNGEKTNLRFDLYSYSAINETLSCNDVKQLQSKILEFNTRVFKRAQKVADSLTFIEKPCYMYTLKVEPKTLFNYVTFTNKLCVDIEPVDSSNNYINGKIYIIREKSYDLPLYIESKTVICDYEISRTLIND